MTKMRQKTTILNTQKIRFKCPDNRARPSHVPRVVVDLGYVSHDIRIRSITRFKIKNEKCPSSRAQKLVPLVLSVDLTH